MKDKRRTCKYCETRLLTWHDQKVQFIRLQKLGFSIGTIKDMTPACQKCVTKWLRVFRSIRRA